MCVYVYCVWEMYVWCVWVCDVCMWDVYTQYVSQLCDVCVCDVWQFLCVWCMWLCNICVGVQCVWCVWGVWWLRMAGRCGCPCEGVGRPEEDAGCPALSLTPLEQDFSLNPEFRFSVSLTGQHVLATFHSLLLTHLQPKCRDCSSVWPCWPFSSCLFNECWGFAFRSLSFHS